MWARKQIDIGWQDLWCAAWQSIVCHNRNAAQSAVESTWSQQRPCLATLSVRSALDLILAAHHWPAGSEVLVSAMTIPDMVKVIEAHGLIAVPLDVDPETMIPSAETMAAAIRPQTRAVLIAHLFGATPEINEHIRIAHESGLQFWEDCAQAYRGAEFIGHPDADASLFSFGTIKASTALGGGIATIRDSELCDAVRELQSRQPVQPTGEYARRIFKYVGLKLLGTRPVFTALILLMKLLKRDFDKSLNASIRGFPKDRMFEMIRRRPCGALLKMLSRRLTTHSNGEHERRFHRGRLLADGIGTPERLPAAYVKPHAYWVIPVIADDPDALILELRKAGFDATQGQSMVVVPSPDSRDDCPTKTISDLLPKIVYLPFYPAMPDHELTRLATCTAPALSQSQQLAATSPNT